MKTYRQFISEIQANVPVVSIDKQYANIHQPEGMYELNKNLALEVSTGFSDLREALNKIRKILAMYALKFPKEDVVEMDKKEGGFTFPVSYHETSGASLTNYLAPGQKSSNNFNLNINYKLEDGAYKVNAEVVKK